MERPWDTNALARTNDIAGVMVATGFAEHVRDTAAAVWARNVARYDASQGDTPRSLGFTASENLSQLLSSHGDGEPAAFTARLADNTVVISHGSTSIRLVKAPASAGLNPDWLSDFHWNAGSTVRRTAAESNAIAYRSASRLEPTLFDMPGDATAGNVDACRELFIVWAGRLGDQRTAGWLGMPVTGDVPFLAVTPLWDDRPGADDSAVPSADAESDSSAPSADAESNSSSPLADAERAGAAPAAH